jgi:hypothetical protein
MRYLIALIRRKQDCIKKSRTDDDYAITADREKMLFQRVSYYHSKRMVWLRTEEPLKTQMPMTVLFYQRAQRQRTDVILKPNFRLEIGAQSNLIEIAQ